MSQTAPEFDGYSTAYDSLLKDPIRDGFAGSADFYHRRKRDLIRQYFRRRQVNTKPLSYLDLGCGKGKLATLLAGDFGRVAGCDPSAGMLESARGIEARVQRDPGTIPFGDAQFDFVTAVCVYHHVPTAARGVLTAEARRVLRPGGIFAIIEHNPWNPVTRLIVSRAAVDADAILLRPAETRALLSAAGFSLDDQSYFLYLPEKLYAAAPVVEDVLRRAPFGGQYAVFAKR